MSTLRVNEVENATGGANVEIGTLEADTLQNTAGTESITWDYVYHGTPKLWCRLNAAAPTIDGDLNTSSVTDYSAGNFNINHSTAMSSTSESSGAGAGHDPGANFTCHAFLACRVSTSASMSLNQTLAGVGTDSDWTECIACGDLA